VATRDHFRWAHNPKVAGSNPAPATTFSSFFPTNRWFLSRRPNITSSCPKPSGHAVEPRCELRGSRPPAASSSRGSGASGPSRHWQRSSAPNPVRAATRLLLGAGARDRQREGVDDHAPVDAQNAPTGACKTAPNQSAVSHTAQQPFVVSVAGKTTATDGAPSSNAAYFVELLHVCRRQSHSRSQRAL
jgi:hypothetical protein